MNHISLIVRFKFYFVCRVVNTSHVSGNHNGRNPSGRLALLPSSDWCGPGHTLTQPITQIPKYRKKSTLRLMPSLPTVNNNSSSRGTGVVWWWHLSSQSVVRSWVLPCAGPKRPESVMKSSVHQEARWADYDMTQGLHPRSHNWLSSKPSVNKTKQDS